METHLPNKSRSHHLYVFYGHSEISEQSLSTKYFCIIFLHDCVVKQQHPPMIAFTVSFARSEVSNLSYMKIIIFSGFSYILSYI